MNKRSVKIFVLVVAVCGLLVSILGCENPVGGTENNPISDFVGKTYKDPYGGLLSIPEAGFIHLGYGENFDTQGKIVDSRKDSTGTVYLLECSKHYNYSPSQYPGYNEENAHSNCYLLLHIRSINGESAEWAQFYTTLEEKGTSCFASSAKTKAQEYLDFSKWGETTHSVGTVVK